MANLNIDSIKERTFDAIVIGSGMSGGWAAKEFTDKGLKTLDAGAWPRCKAFKDYPTTNMYPWEFEHHGVMPHGGTGC
jgi:choline dehydrogenase-like flavoprotein